MRTKNINTIRGFAALIVFVMHFFTIPQSTKISTGLLSNVEQGVYAVIMAGYSGVGLFIFLSGYLLTQSKLKYNENFRTYLLWRFLRIYPVYLIILILSIIASRQWDWHGFLNALFLLPNLPGTLWPFPWLATAWSLGVEWTLYFSLFFLVYVNLLHKKNIMALQLLFFGLMILAGTQGTDKHTIVSGSLLGRSIQFSLGVLFAITLKNYKIFQGISRQKLILFSGLIYLSWAVISWRAGGVSSNGSWRLIQPYAESFICACLILCAEKEQRRLNIFTRGMSFLGKVSYPFYLIHVTVLVSLDGLILKTKFLELETHIYAIVFFTSTLSVAVLISTFFHFGIEEPIDNLKASRRQKSKF